ncbi:MAG: O-acetyl-ADP-ribose deacetylase [Bacteroidales bacterium]|jgi:O-acetyl-ADP-ribose deacetylase (regulator of RNase III)|nr:O-acetyl-ADP-ribose deacetylase [Bacteroidales bacterium]
MKLELIIGDITKETVDAIVNAANSSLMGGGGVDGAIHKAAGPQLLQECQKIIGKIGTCATGKAVITMGCKLPAKYIIHTVGPVWNGGGKNEEKLLENCYENCIALAVEYKLESIAFPNISTGIYGFPKDKAVQIVCNYFKKVKENDSVKNIKLVRFVCFDNENYALYKKQGLFG